MKSIIQLLFISTLIILVSCSVKMNSGKLTVSPGSLNFGQLLVQKETATREFSINNNSNKNMKISEIQIVNDIECNFEIIAGSEGKSVSACSIQSIKVKFSPKTTGLISCKIRIKFKSKKSPIDISLSGTGISAELSIKPDANPYDFSKVVLYSNIVKTFTLKNNCASSVQILSFEIVKGDNFSVYAASCPVNLAGKSSLMFVVSFHPTKTGFLSDFLLIEHSALFSPFKIKLTGFGSLPKIVDYLRLEHFDSNRLPSHWKFSCKNYCWQWGPITNLNEVQAHSLPNCLGTNLSGNYDNCQDNRLESPIIDLRKACYPILSFWQIIKTAYQQGGDGGLLEICTSDEANYEIDCNWSEWEELESVYPAYSIEDFNGTGKSAFGGNEFEIEWKEIRADLAPFAGKFVKIGWHFISDRAENDAGWFIDSVHAFEIVRD